MEAGGGIHGHPDGTRAGTALRAAVDGYVAGETLDEAADSSPELAAAIDEWGTGTPR